MPDVSTKVRHLTLPLDEEAARSLTLGEMVTLTGPVFTGRSRFHIRAATEGILPPVDFTEVNAFFHVGPVMRKVDGGWSVVSIEPTSSIRFERYAAQVVRDLGLRTLIGKTTMGPATAEALREVGGVYLSKIGVCGNTLSQQVRRVREVHFVEELGKTEATWVFEVERFGPFFVAIDARGRNYFQDLARASGAALAKELGRCGVSADYAYTDVSPKGFLR